MTVDDTNDCRYPDWDYTSASGGIGGASMTFGSSNGLSDDGNSSLSTSIARRSSPTRQILFMYWTPASPKTFCISGVASTRTVNRMISYAMVNGLVNR